MQEVEIIDKLISDGIDVGDIKNLQDVGIYTCNDLLMYKKEVKSVVCTTTGRALDEHHALSHLLSYGKTLLEIPTSVKGKTEKAAYINTEGTFRPDLVVLINEKFGMDATAVLDNARAYTSEQQDNLLFALPAKMAEEPFQSLTVDSIAALFQIGSSGKGEVAEQQLESVGYEPVVDDDTGDEADDQDDDEAGEDDLDDDEMDADEADADEADDLADDDEHEENDDDDDMSEVEEDFPDEVGSIPIVVAIYDGDEVVEERTIESISYELSESLHSLPQLEAIVVAKIEGSQLLPEDHECYYQTSKSRYGGDFANMPTEYCYLVQRLDRILIDRPQQD